MATYTITPSPNAVLENTGLFTFTISRDGPLAARTGFITTLEDQGSVNNGDFVGFTDMPVSFLAGQATTQFTIQINPDQLEELNESFSVILQTDATQPNTVFAAKAVFTIVNDDLPTYSISPDNVSVDESAGTITFTIDRTGLLIAETVFASTLDNQGSTNDGDYTALSDLTVDFLAGQTSTQVTVTLSDDALAELSETYGFVIQRNASDPDNVFLDSTTFTLLDNDETSYTIDPTSVSVNEDGTASFTVTRVGALTAATLYATTLEDQGSVNNGDYVALSDAEVNFAVGASTANITVTLNPDLLEELDESFSLIIQTATDQPDEVFVAKSVFTILNDDLPTYSISPDTVSVNESAGTITFTIDRTGLLIAETLFASTLKNQGSTNNGDFTALIDFAVDFVADQASAQVTVTLTDDAIAELTETFGFVLQRNAEDPDNVFLNSSIFTILDDEPTTYAIDPTSVVVNENAGTVTFNVNRTGTLVAETLFASTLENQGSTNSGDYTALADANVDFAAGQTTTQVTITLNNDVLAEADETFGLVVQRTAADPDNVFLAAATYTIQSDDTVYSIDPAAITVNESAGTVTFTVNRTGVLSEETVYASTTQDRGSTNNGDYTALTDVALAFGSGQASTQVVVNLTNDTIAELTETFGFVVQRNTTDADNVFLASSGFTITDNDPTAYSVAPNVQVTEGTGTVTFTVTRTGLLPAETLFATTTQDQGWTSQQDFVAQNDRQIVFAAGATTANLTFAVLNDTWFENPENYGVVFQRNSTDPVSTFLAKSTFTINDNEAPFLINQYPIVIPSAPNEHILIGSPRNPFDGGITTPNSQRQWTYEISTRGQTGYDVHAISSGTVVMVRDDLTATNVSTSYGNAITIRADDGYYYSLMHLTPFSAQVVEGQHVNAGDVLALSGESGSSDEGPHEHLLVGSHTTLIALFIGDLSTQELVANGQYDDYAPVYFPSWQINFSDGDDSDVLYYGFQGVDNFNGNNVANFAQGFGGDDVLRGREGNDTLDGGVGNDTMVGGTENDTYYVDSVGDVVTESASQGTDKIISTVSWSLSNNVENLTLIGNNAINAQGSAQKNTIIGNNAANNIGAAGGVDIVSGLGGNDTLSGADGNDSLSGGDGLDVLSGGAGTDYFLFDTPLTSADSVVDFVHLTDKIGLDNAIFTTFGTFQGQLGVNAFFAGSAAHDLTDRIMYDPLTGAVYYDADGNLAAFQQVQVAQLTAGLELTNVDFIIFHATVAAAAASAP